MFPCEKEIFPVLQPLVGSVLLPALMLHSQAEALPQSPGLSNVLDVISGALFVIGLGFFSYVALIQIMLHMAAESLTSPLPQ